MNAAPEKNGLGAVFDLAAGLLKNPAVIEGIITGISALSASQRVKNPKTDKEGIDLGGVLEMLPQILPLLSLLKSPLTDASVADESVSALAEVSGNDANTDENVTPAVSEETDTGSKVEDAVSVGIFDRSENNITYGTKEEQRENLLMAIRPFLSESRVAAADAMIQINRVSGIFRA